MLCSHLFGCRRCLCEWLQTDAISRGLAAAATAGARAAVQAAVAAERHEVSCTYCVDHTHADMYVELPIGSTIVSQRWGSWFALPCKQQQPR